MIIADLSISSIAWQRDTNLRRTQDQQGSHLLLVLAPLRSSANFSKDCLQSLFFPEMLSRENDITDATDETCDWLLQHTEYTTWLRRDRELLWIKGKPGAGKSTILKHALRDAKERADDKERAPRNKLVVASFFFHGRGSSIQKSSLGMFRSLLHQILDQIPEFLSEFTSIFTKKREAQGRPGAQWEWHVAELRNFFGDSIAQAKTTYSIEIYVDALDECGEETARALVADFERLISRTTSRGPNSLNLCFSCRHYPIVALEYGRSICVERENDQDIRTYVGAQLERGISESSKAQVLQEEIVEKALGVFQWVFLVTPKVLKLHQEGRNMNAIRKSIRQIPSELSDLYRGLLQDIPNDERPQSLLLMQWIFFALSPLSLTELRSAMAVVPDSPYKSFSEMQKDSMQHAETDDEMEKMMKSLSRGLMEVLKDQYGQLIVQFNHQSINDYLLVSGFRDLGSPSEVSVLGRAHFQLSRSCIRFITMTEVLHRTTDHVEELRKIFPFLDYAAQYWVDHAKIVEAESIAQDDLLHIFAWPSNHVLKRLVRTNHGLRPFYTTNIKMTLLHIASRAGIYSSVIAILSSLHSSSIFLNSKDDSGTTPLSYAAAQGHEKIVKLLLEREGIEINSEDSLGQTALSSAAQNGHERTVEILLEREGIEINSEDRWGRAVLSHAAQSGNKRTVEILLEREGIEINSEDRHGQTPLSCAAQFGNKRMVELLLEREGIEINSKDKKGRTPLLHAVRNRRETIVKLLLEREDIQIMAKGREGDTPLSLAIELGHHTIVELLQRKLRERGEMRQRRSLPATE
jgi:ankyrin repeat protein